MEHTDLTVIVLNWNTRDLLRDCLDSVLRDPASRSWQVLVVDNASSDGSAAMVRDRFPEVELLANEENVGFARANNRALGLARGRHIVLLNSDTVVLDRALGRLLAYLDRHPAVGAVGPALVLPGGSLPVVNAGHQPTIGRMLAHALALPQLLPPRLAPRGIHLPSDGRTEPREVEWLSGACLMVRSEVIREVGPLSERWFMYAEDMEWCDRIGQHGWRLVYLPEHRVVHYGGASLKQGPMELSTLWARSFFAHYARRCHASRLARAAFGASFASGWLLRATFHALRAGASNARDRRARLGRSGAALRYAGVGLAFALTGRADSSAERGTRSKAA